MKLKTKKSIYPKVILSIVVLGLVGYLVFAKTTDRWPFSTSPISSPSAEQSTDTDDVIDDQPATPTDEQMADEQKQTTYDRDQSKEKPDRPNVKTVDVTLTTLYREGDKVHANGFVSGVVENNGTCTFTLTDQAGKTVSTSRKGHENATNTTCGQSTIEASQLHPGKWTATLTYSSATATGISSNEQAPSIEINS